MRILLVEGSRFFKAYTKALLEKYRLADFLQTCATVEEALQLLQEETFDVIILDAYTIGFLDLENIARLRSRDQKARILLMAQYGDSETIEKAFALGANDYLIKPIRETEFITRLLAARRSREELANLANGGQVPPAWLARSPAPLHLLDDKLRLAAAGEDFLHVLGFEKKEVIGRYLGDFLTITSRQYAEEAVFPELLRKGHCRDVPLQLVTGAGETREVFLTAVTAPFTKDGSKTYLASVIDATELLAEMACLQEREEKWRHLVEGLPAGLFRLNREGELVAANTWFQEALLGSFSSLIGRSLFSFCPGKELLQKMLDKAFLHGEARGILTLLRPDGNLVDCRIILWKVAGDLVGKGELAGLAEAIKADMGMFAGRTPK